jgi:hypothetical protein
MNVLTYDFITAHISRTSESEFNEALRPKHLN